MGTTASLPPSNFQHWHRSVCLQHCFLCLQQYSFDCSTVSFFCSMFHFPAGVFRSSVALFDMSAAPCCLSAAVVCLRHQRSRTNARAKCASRQSPTAAACHHRDCLVYICQPPLRMTRRTRHHLSQCLHQQLLLLGHSYRSTCRVTTFQGFFVRANAGHFSLDFSDKHHTM